MQCHYEVLSVAQDADAATIKKAHRKLAVKWHPDKNLNDPDAAERFRTIQEAYECLSDPSERKWYDEHRDALLKGWSPNGRSDNDVDGGMLFDVIPFMHAHCYTGYADKDDDQSFYAVYGNVFASLSKEEADAVESAAGNDKTSHTLPFDFGNSQTDGNDVSNFYQIWESFVSQQTFSWADQYDVKEAENRRVRRAMEDENKKARKAARKARNDDILALVRFVKRRDPRIKALKLQQEQEKAKREKEQMENKKLKKKEAQVARDKWRQQAEENMAQTEEMDRLAGRVRLADLEDDYDYGGGKKKGKKGKKKNKNQQAYQEEEEENDSEQNGNGDNGDGENSTSPAQVPDVLVDENGIPLIDENNDDENDTNIDDNPLEPTNEAVAELEGTAELDKDEEESPVYDDNDSLEEDEFSSEEESEEEEPEVWRCECCKKDFKSQGQMDNHMKSKKHKEAFKKFQAKKG